VLSSTSLRCATGGVTVDIRTYPIVIVTWYGLVNEQVVDEYFEVNEAIAAHTAERREKYCVITDTEFAERPPPTVRKRIAERTDAIEERYGPLVAASYLVVPSVVIRGAITAIQWVSRSQWATDMRRTMPEAFALAREALQKVGTTPPPPMGATGYQRWPYDGPGAAA
jgi:hypothetical protein